MTELSVDEKLKVIQYEPNKYQFKTKDNQRINIEYKTDDFIYLTLFKWGNEASLQITLDTVPVKQHVFTENKIEVEDPDYLLRVYPIDTRTTGDFYGDSEDVVQCHDGGVRFELVLKKHRPAMGNSITFPVISKNLRYGYQPFLTQKDLDEGISCPLNAEGSWAAYHISKKNNQYMTGKAFHVYRPIAEDALGSKAWCAIHFDAYLDPKNLTITIPQQFLDEATYPVTIDPDFGYSAIGANSYSFTGAAFEQRTGSAWTMPAPGGTANFIQARIHGGAACDCKVFINEKDSGGAGTHAQIATDGNLNCGAVEHWEQFNLAGEALTQAVDYILSIVGNEDDLGAKQNYFVRYDADGATAIASYTENQDYDAPESPWVVAAAGATWDFSIYCDYDVGVETHTKTFTFDALLKKSLTQTFTLDGLLQKELTKTFTFDGWLQKAFTQTFTLDGILILQKTKIFTLDALLQKELTKTFTLDGLLQKELTKTFTLDGVLILQKTKTFTLDALLQKELTKTFTLDGILILQKTKNFTLDALLQKSLTKTFTLDALLQKEFTKSFTLDGLLQKSLTQTFTFDGWLQKAFTKTFTFDALLQKSLTQAFTFDALLQKSLTKTFTLDGLLQKSLTQTFTFDALLLKSFTQTFTLDALLQKTLTKTFTFDAILDFILPVEVISDVYPPTLRIHYTADMPMLVTIRRPVYASIRMNRLIRRAILATIDVEALIRRRVTESFEVKRPIITPKFVKLMRTVYEFLKEE